MNVTGEEVNKLTAPPMVIEVEPFKRKQLEADSNIVAHSNIIIRREHNQFCCDRVLTTGEGSCREMVIL
jgi:hypothetical protein